MPVTKRSVGKGKVQVRTPGGIKAKATTPAKAASQTRLLNAVEPDREKFAKRVMGGQ